VYRKSVCMYVCVCVCLNRDSSLMHACMYVCMYKGGRLGCFRVSCYLREEADWVCIVSLYVCVCVCMYLCTCV
jgi:hypothetical protein